MSTKEELVRSIQGSIIIIVTKKLKFQKINLDAKESIEKYVHKFQPYSDFNYLSLYTYNTNDAAEYCFLNGNLVIKFEDYITGEAFYSILGRKRLNKSIETLINNAKQEKLQPVLKLVPEETIKHGRKLHEKWQIEEDKNNFDYIVSSKEIAEEHEVRLPKKKKIIDEFKANYPNLKVQKIDLTNRIEQQKILDLFDQWATHDGHLAGDAMNERKALARLLEAARNFDKLYALGIYEDDKLVAFNTYDLATPEHGTSSFQKADRNYDGIYAMLTHEMAKDLHSLGCKYINFEQDLGIEGLRASKKSWHPVSMLKKYTISEKV